mmetsp:Transcript_7623/g.21659  ORF Transcript_7623/g.21659 Transcript_7623/m.21659 type:complete len:204 (-) Transcript_7623:96-707(-)
MAAYERRLEPVKRRLFRPVMDAAGPLRVVELGIGTGANVGYIARPGVTVTGVDLNPEMLRYARRGWADAGMAGGALRLVEAPAEATGLPAGCADVVVATLLLCSVADPGEVLREVGRLLAPRGRFLFVEHVAAPAGSPLRGCQAALDPLQQALAGGCHLTRETGAAVLEHFPAARVESFQADGLCVLSPHVAGEAVAGPAPRL